MKRLAVRVLEILVVAAFYGGAARLGLMAAIPPGHASALWPPSGIALAAVVLRGNRVWPGIWLGSFAANQWVLLERSDTPLLAQWLTASAIGIGASLGAILGAALLRRYVRRDRPFSTAQGAVRFILLGGLASCLVSPTVGTATLCVAGFDAWSHFGASWLTWWLGDVAGVIIVSPLALTWTEPRLREEGTPRPSEAAAFLGLLVLACWIGFFGRFPLGFTVIPVLVWGALRFRQRGSTAAIFVVSCFAVAGAVEGLGPFRGSGLTLNQSLLLLQAFMGVLALTTLVLAGLMTEREEASHELRRYRDHLEQRVEERTRQLGAANRELEAFNYAVSHDLRSPLTAIHGSVDILLMAHAEGLDERGRAALGRIRSSADRMEDLIRGLLELSFVEKCAVERKPINLSALAREIGGSLTQRDSQRQVSVEVQDGLTAVGDERLLRIALENLLGNAWKFTAHHARARIEVAAAAFNGERAFFVRDDGAGFDNAAAENLFRTFHRLHSASDFPGTGIGLSTVRRIVEHHGGRIWADAAVEKGATFYFTLP